MGSMEGEYETDPGLSIDTMTFDIDWLIEIIVPYTPVHACNFVLFRMLLAHPVSINLECQILVTKP